MVEWDASVGIGWHVGFSLIHVSNFRFTNQLTTKKSPAIARTTFMKPYLYEVSSPMNSDKVSIWPKVP
jgi:hypothetical protein